MRLGDICNIGSGGTPSRKKLEFYGGNIPWAKISDIENAQNGILTATEESITEEGLNDIRNKLFPVGTLLFAMYGSIGKVAITGRKMATNQAILGITPKDKDIISLDYLKIWFEANKQQLLNQGRGVTLKNLSATIIRDLDVPIPAYQTQLHIANILTKAESLIAQRKESLRLHDEYLKSVFLEMFGDPVRNEKKYRIVEISEISTHIKDGPHVSPKYSENGIPILSTRNIRPGKLIMDELKYVSEQTYTELTKRFKPQKFDVLITKGGTTGYAKVVDFDFEFCIWVHLACVRLKSTVNPFYFEHAFNSDYCYFQARKFTHGITNQDLGLTRIAKIKLLLPPIELQTKFAKIVEKTEALKTQYQQSLQVLENLYGSLSQKAFKGELDLKDESLLMAAEPEITYNKK